MGLPEEKINKLAEKVADDVRKVAKENYDNLRQHEVSPQDAAKVIGRGLSKATITPKLGE